jgi:hypothetical protein
VIYFFLWHQRTPDNLFQGDMLFGRMLAAARMNRTSEAMSKAREIISVFLSVGRIPAWLSACTQDSVS